MTAMWLMCKWVSMVGRIYSVICIQIFFPYMCFPFMVEEFQFLGGQKWLLDLQDEKDLVCSCIIVCFIY